MQWPFGRSLPLVVVAGMFAYMLSGDVWRNGAATQADSQTVARLRMVDE